MNGALSRTPKSRRRTAVSALATALAIAVLATALTPAVTPAFAVTCTVQGTNGADVLYGTDGDDTVCGGGGADTIYGGGGRDQLFGGTGEDKLYGGPGDDLLYGENEKDNLFGEEGNDTLAGGVGADILDGGDGNDSLDGGNEPDVLFGRAGDDTVFGALGLDKLDGGAGNDTLDGGNDADTLQGGEGTDSLNGRLGIDTLDGGPGNDTLIGENDADTMYGGTGNDALVGGLGNDKLYGGPGNDNLNGNNDQNTCDGGTGVNVLLSCSTSVNPGGPDPEGDWADSDTDGLIDSLEIRAGTDVRAVDTDRDGLSDGDEVLGITDPTKRDTDRNGVADGADDPDHDGLTTADETVRGTKPGSPDSDGDLRKDGDEISRGTNPLSADSDADSLTDGEEQEVGSDPLNVDTDGDDLGDGYDIFDKSVAGIATSAVFHATGTARALLQVELTVPDDEQLVDVPGQRAPPVEIYAPLPLEPGTLSIPFDTRGLDESSNLAVLTVDEESGAFRVAPYSQIDLAGGFATVRTPVSDEPTNSRQSAPSDPVDPDQLSSLSAARTAGLEDGAATTGAQFMVVDIDAFAQIWADEITVPREGHSSGPIDVVLTLDSSGSMTTNDPEGGRRTAAKAFVEALSPGDRAAVVDFDSYATIFQSLTSDLDSVKSAIDLVDDSGGTDLSAGLDAALDELDAHGYAGSQRMIVFLTDGDGTYNSSTTSRAIETDTVFYTVGLGRGTNTGLLNDIATATGGQFYYVPDAGGLPDAFEGIGSDTGEPDADGDGLADAAETGGYRDGFGHRFVTDPDDADTDGDGLTDGEEAGELLYQGGFGRGSYFNAFSNPMKADSDGDTLTDLYERAEILPAWKKDVDRDTLTDAQETQTYSTEAFSDDSDVDGFADKWEIEHESEGFDPLIFDYQTSPLEYVGEFARGALCGDIEGVGDFCVGQSLAYLIGNIAGGIIPLADLRDGLAGLARGDVLAAAFSAAALIPIGGDIAAGVKKYEKFIRSADDLPSGAALRSAMKDAGQTTAQKMDLLRKVAPTAVSRLRSANIPDLTIIRLARKQISAAHFENMVAAAQDIKKAPSVYALESGAESFLRKADPQSLPGQVKSSTRAGVVRFYDVLNPTTALAKEIKHGRTGFVGRAANQLAKDVLMRSGGSGSNIDTVEWHFFTSARDHVGPDLALLAELQRVNMPFVLWVA